MDQHAYIQSIAGCSGISKRVAYAHLVASVHTFYTAVKHQYDGYITDDDSRGKIETNDFISILSTINISSDKQQYGKIIELSISLSEWANSAGPFKTLTEKVNLNEVW